MADFLVIPDTQIPFEHRNGLRWLRSVARFYRIQPDNIWHCGDECDLLFASQYPKDPNIPMSATHELKRTREVIAEWGAVFPKMKIAISNHGLRWVRKATAAEIPSELLRQYSDIIGAPKGWRWAYEWKSDTKHPFRMIHGMGYSGKDGHRNAALDAGMSTVIGHLHSHAGINHIATGGQRIWGMNVGCLIDKESFAFAYGRESRFKPVLGCGLIFEDGRTPVFLPFE